jgi:hypothetical protein
MIDKRSQVVDVLMCVGPQDIESLFVYSARSCFKNFKNIGRLYIVSPQKKLLQQKLKEFDFYPRCEFLNDSDVLSKSLMQEDGWYRQQIIKLSAHNFCQTELIGSLCSDTIILNKVSLSDFIDNNFLPIVFFRIHRDNNPHFVYEQRRIKHICSTLEISGEEALKYCDFIIDFKICEASILKDLNFYLRKKYGSNYFKAISPGKCLTLEEKVVMAEWTLYGAYVADIYSEKRTFRGYGNNFITQIHSTSDYSKFDYSAKIVHFVNKNLNFDHIKSQLDNMLK